MLSLFLSLYYYTDWIICFEALHGIAPSYICQLAILHQDL